MVANSHIVGIDLPGSPSSLSIAATKPATMNMVDVMKLYGGLLVTLVLSLAFNFAFQQYSSDDDAQYSVLTWVLTFVLVGVYASLLLLLKKDLANAEAGVVLGTYILLHSVIVGVTVSTDKTRLAIWVVSCLICTVVLLMISCYFDVITLTSVDGYKMMSLVTGFIYIVAFIIYTIGMPRVAFIAAATIFAAYLTQLAINSSKQNDEKKKIGRLVADLILDLTMLLFIPAYMFKIFYAIVV